MEPLYTFAQAIEMVMRGAKMCRRGWNGIKTGNLEMFVQAQRPDEHSKMTHPYLYMTARGTTDGLGWTERTPWQPSQHDMFANDWLERVE